MPPRVPPGDPKPTVSAPRAQEELVVFDRHAIGEDEALPGGVDRANDHPRSALHAVRLVPSGRPDQPRAEVGFAPQERLRERRPAEGDAQFVAEKQDRPCQPSSRRITAVVSPARPAPMMTAVRSLAPGI